MSSKLAVIAGSGGVLGAALVAEFAAAGYAVATLGREAVHDSPHATAEIVATHGSVDVLVYNAAHLVVAPFAELRAADFETAWRASVLGAVGCIQAVLPGMLQRGRGALVFSGATASVRGAARFAAFASAKFALRGLAQSLAREHHAQGIHVAHVVLDGLLRGSPSIGRFGGQEDHALDPGEVARTYRWLAEQPASAWAHEVDLRHSAGEVLMNELRVHADRTLPALVHGGRLPWQASPEPGVERRFLERIGGEVALATSIVRYRPGSRFGAHAHDLGEEFLVLEGTFSDEHGHYPAGSYVRNPPGSRHAPFSSAGCVIFVKLRQMQAGDTDQVRALAENQVWQAAATPGRSRLPLHAAQGIEVSLERLAAGAALPPHRGPGGQEVFVVDGSVSRVGDDQPALDAWAWMRHPGPGHPALVSSTGALLWIKRGHLTPPRDQGTAPWPC